MVVFKVKSAHIYEYMRISTDKARHPKFFSYKTIDEIQMILPDESLVETIS